MMKHKGFLMGVFSVLLVFGLVLVGCSTDDGGGGGVLDLDDIPEDETTGLSEIKVTNASLKGTVADGEYTSESTGGGSFSAKGTVANGKFTLTLNEPEEDKLAAISKVNENSGGKSEVFGKTDSEYAISIPSDSDAKYCMVSVFKATIDGTEYYIERAAVDTDDNTYC